MTAVRVLHVINQFPAYGGAETSLRELIKASEGPEVHHGVCVLKREGSAFDDVVAIGADYFTPAASSLGLVGRFRHVCEAVRAFAPDVVHSSIFDADVAARLASWRLKVPVLVSLVNTPYAGAARIDSRVQPVKLRVVQAVDRFLARRLTDRFHAITGAVAIAAVRDLGVPRDKITVIPRGRSQQVFVPLEPDHRAKVRRALGLSQTAIVLLSVGREEAQKGHIYLLDAMAMLIRARDDVVLIHAGRNGAQTPAIEARLAADSSLVRSVRRLGVRADIADLLAAADVFVFPSLYEGLGGSLIEAMAVGVPIVAGDSPAVREVLDGGTCGVLVPIATSAPLAGAVLTILDDPVGTAAMVSRARARFLDHYESSTVALEMVKLWRSFATDIESR